MGNSNDSLLAYFQKQAHEEPDKPEWAQGAKIMQEFVSIAEQEKPDFQALHRVLELAENGSKSYGSAWTDMTIRIRNFNRTCIKR